MAAASTLIQFMVASWFNVRRPVHLRADPLVWILSPARTPFLHKLGVVTMLLADGICVLDINVAVCLNATGAALKSPYGFVAPVAVQIITTYTSAAVAQLFFMNLYYALTLNVTISAILTLLVAVHVGFSWASAFILLAQPGSLDNFSFTATTIGAISCAVTDIIIAACLVTKFWLMMRRTVPGRAARSLVRRITILVVASGAVCATTTLTMMILLLKNSFVFNFLFVLQGRIYALSILGNLNLGVPGRTPDNTSPTRPFGSTLSHSLAFNPPLEADTIALPPRSRHHHSSRSKSFGGGGSRRHPSSPSSPIPFIDDDQDDSESPVNLQLEELTFAPQANKSNPNTFDLSHLHQAIPHPLPPSSSLRCNSASIVTFLDNDVRNFTSDTYSFELSLHAGGVPPNDSLDA
ncbi:hypothetical protein R3P38DRAFT_3259232 [Favolaschia claudopus]|uniref:DUF6534 domain-containing protein n=1 Tax=Favolaschia claudopus TaxID=2862362 RepID=A0AAW0D5U9_9AGAR